MFFVVSVIASGLDSGMDRLEWGTILPSALIAVVLAPFAGLAGWLIVRLSRVKEDLDAGETDRLAAGDRWVSVPCIRTGGSVLQVN